MITTVKRDTDSNTVTDFRVAAHPLEVLLYRAVCDNDHDELQRLVRQEIPSNVGELVLFIGYLSEKYNEFQPYAEKKNEKAKRAYLSFLNNLNTMIDRWECPDSLARALFNWSVPYAERQNEFYGQRYPVTIDEFLAQQP